jgi:predicted MFS family arabinose efflux permease
MGTIVLAIAGFSFQQASMNAMLPELQATFSATTAWSTWVVTAFLLIGAVATPVIGRLGDQFGRLRALRATLLVFALACVGATLAPSIGVLIALRAVCGVSAACLALGVALVAARVPRERATGATATLAVAMTASNIFGVALAPEISVHLSWRWVFAVNALPPLVALALSIRIPSDPSPSTHRRIDVAGALLMVVCIGALMLALTEGDALGWGSAAIIALLLTSVAAAAAWVWAEQRSPEPMIDPRVMVRGVVLVTNTVVLLAGASIFAALVLIARFVAAPRGAPAGTAALVHYGFGASAIGVGMLFLPTMVLATAAASLLGRAARRCGWKWPLVAALGTLTISLVALAAWHSHVWEVVIATTVFGISLSTSTIGAKLVADAVRPAAHAAVAGVNMVAFYIGGVVGTQAVTAMLVARRIPGTPFPTAAAYSSGLLVLAGASLIGLLLALLIQPMTHVAEREALVVVPAATIDAS